MEDAILQIIIQAKNDAEKVVKGAQADAKNLGKEFDSTSKKAIEMGKKVALGMAAGATALTVFAKQSTDFTVEYVKNTKKIARETGATEEQASRLVFALRRVGLTAEDASATFGIFSKNISNASQASAKNRVEYEALQTQMEKTQFEIKTITEEVKKNGDKTGELGVKLRGLQADMNGLQLKSKELGTTFDKLGIELTDATGKQKGFQDILLEVADKFQSMPAGIDKTALSMELFGRSGKDMIPLLNKGRDGILELASEADKLGITLTSKTIASVNRLIASQRKMKENTDAIKLAVGNLTTPVLAAFNEKLAAVIGGFQNLNPKMQAAIANVLAFGGPVLGATSATIAFAANLATTIQAMGGVRAAAAALGAFMTNPLLLGIILTTAAVGALTFAYITQKSSADQLKAAHEAVAQSNRDLQLAQDGVKKSSLDVEGANLRVEQAQRLYNEAVKQYGPNSLEARQANYDLQQAILAKKDAEDQARQSLDKMKQAEKEYAKDKDFELSMAKKRDEVNGLQGAINNLMNSVNSQVKAGKSKFGGDFDLVKTLRNAFGGFASGTSFAPGGWSVVGEEGPELQYVPRGAQIFPHGASKQMASSIAAGSDNSRTVNITNYNNFVRESDPMAFARAQAFELNRR